MAHLAWEPFPAIDLRQLLRLSDDTGIFQHALFSTPDLHHGYCVDDNARALIAALAYQQLCPDDADAVPLDRYLAFVAYAWNPDTQSFRNFMGYHRQWLEDTGSHDSQARTIWSLGLAAAHAPTQATRDLAHNLWNRGLLTVERLQFIRSWAFVLVGLDAFLQHEPDHPKSLQVQKTFGQKLFDAYQRHATEDWPWWESRLTYDNAKLSHALLVTGHALKRDDMIEAALTSLRWLLQVQRAPAGHLSIIGNDGWLERGKPKADFDQQPLEAYALVHACLAAAKHTGDRSWEDHAWVCFEWFRGQNDRNESLYDPQTGGCRDGLASYGPNQNQGAESSLAYLLSVLELHRHRQNCQA